MVQPTEQDVITTFVAKINNHGTWQWAIISTGRSRDNGISITVDCDGQIYTTGNFNGTPSFSGIVLTQTGFTNCMYTTKVSDDENAQIVGIATEAGREGSTINAIYCPGTVSDIYTDLVPGASYYIDKDAKPTIDCKCSAYPRCPRYIGMACKSSELIFNPFK